MCKYCKEEAIYRNYNGELYIPEECAKCGLESFKPIEDEHCKDLGSYSLTKYISVCEMEYGLTTLCQCDFEPSEYLLVTVKEYVEMIGKEIDYKAWLNIVDMGEDFSECLKCGNDKDLYHEVNKLKESASLSIICPACHCVVEHELN